MGQLFPGTLKTTGLKHIFWAFGFSMSNMHMSFPDAMRSRSRCCADEFARHCQMGTQQSPAFEKRLWNKMAGRLLEMCPLISDLRSAKIFSVWMVRGYWSVEFHFSPSVTSFIGEWLKKVSSGALLDVSGVSSYSESLPKHSANLFQLARCYQRHSQGEIRVSFQKKRSSQIAMPPKPIQLPFHPDRDRFQASLEGRVVLLSSPTSIPLPLRYRPHRL